MTALAEACLAAGWLMALETVAAGFGWPRREDGRPIEAVLVGLGKFGGRELSTGSDLDLFVVYSGHGTTDGPERVEAHVFYDRAVELLGAALGDITAAGVVFPVDLRLRPGSKGSGFASSLEGMARYYREWADPWERQTLTRARLAGDPVTGRAVRRLIRDLLYGPGAGARPEGDARPPRAHAEGARPGDAGLLHVKFGRAGWWTWSSPSRRSR